MSDSAFMIEVVPRVGSNMCAREFLIIDGSVHVNAALTPRKTVLLAFSAPHLWKWQCCQVAKYGTDKKPVCHPSAWQGMRIHLAFRLTSLAD